MTPASAKQVRLGLIGDNITRSKSPRLHREAGRLTGLDVTYDRLIPRDMGLSFDEVFSLRHCGCPPRKFPGREVCRQELVVNLVVLNRCSFRCPCGTDQ
ncbi:hypothetical protein [Cribrihabitans pelagius]|uniref:hypothetical protein n=1 Tax=Cribrihabitans pelagius TaxID=1765746 RepID=UPI003B5BABA5